MELIDAIKIFGEDFIKNLFKGSIKCKEGRSFKIYRYNDFEKNLIEFNGLIKFCKKCNNCKRNLTKLN